MLILEHLSNRRFSISVIISTSEVSTVLAIYVSRSHHTKRLACALPRNLWSFSRRQRFALQHFPKFTRLPSSVAPNNLFLLEKKVLAFHDEKCTQDRPQKVLTSHNQNVVEIFHFKKVLASHDQNLIKIFHRKKFQHSMVRMQSRSFIEKKFQHSVIRIWSRSFTEKKL